MCNCLKTWMAAIAATLVIATSAHAVPVSGQGTWETTLQARDLDGNGATDAFYDTTLNITWLRNADVNGQMDWHAANTWAAGYSFGGYSDWRLPTMVDTGSSGCNWSVTGGTDCGSNVQTTSGSTVYNEVASLWYDALGNKNYFAPGTGINPQPGWGLTNTGDFLNMQSALYWQGLLYAPHPREGWYFNTMDGSQKFEHDVYRFYAMAVRPGDVLAATVPEPATYAMMLAGLGLMGLTARRRKAKQTS